VFFSFPSHFFWEILLASLFGLGWGILILDVILGHKMLHDYD